MVNSDTLTLLNKQKKKKRKLSFYIKLSSFFLFVAMGEGEVHGRGFGRGFGCSALEGEVREEGIESQCDKCCVEDLRPILINMCSSIYRMIKPKQQKQYIGYVYYCYTIIP